MKTSDQIRNVRQSSFGWMVQRLARQLEEDMTARLSGIGISIQQFAILMRVLEGDGLSQVEIGEIFAMPAYVISRALDGLEAKKMIARRPHPTSRRAHLICPDQVGIALAAELSKVVQEVNRELCAPLSPAERAQFGELLQKLVLG